MVNAVIILLLGNMLAGSFEYRNVSPLNLFPSYLSVSENDDPGSVTNPSYLPHMKYQYMNFSMDNPYGLSGLFSNSASLGASNGRLGFQFAWRSFGIKQYREDILEANLGFMFFKWLSAGSGFTYYSLNIDSGEVNFKTGLSDCRGSLHATPFSWITFSFEQDNLKSLADKGRDDLLYPEKRFGAMLTPIKGFSLSWNINRTSYDYVNYFSLGARLLPFLFIRGGYSRETSVYSAAFSIAVKNFSLSYGFRFHSFLGLTHTVGLTASYNMIKYDNLNYYSGKKRIDDETPKNRININSCSEDELRKIPVINEVMAGRILKYREMIGPLSNNSLGQIGFNDRDLKRLMNYVYGLAPDDRNIVNTNEKKKPGGAFKGEKTFMKKNGLSIKARKIIFEKLLNTGLSAGMSLMISEAAVKKEFRELQEAVNSIPGLTPEKRKEIIKICME